MTLVRETEGVHRREESSVFHQDLLSYLDIGTEVRREYTGSLLLNWG